MRISARISTIVDTTSHQLKRSRVACLLFLIISVIALAVTPAAQAQTNFVYVTNRTATTNTVSGFAVDAGGVLTAVPGSPFSTGGTGANMLCAAIDRITVSPSRNLLFVANSGDQTISVMQINAATGALTPVVGSPFATGLTLDSCAGISLAATPDGKFLMASSNGTIKTFSIAPTTGVLTLAQTGTGLPTPMVGMKISGNGQFLAVSHQNSVSIFTINLDGSLTAVAGSPFSKLGTGLLGGLEFNCDGTILYGGEGGSTTSITDAWSVAPGTGALTPIVGSPFSATGSDSNVVFLTPDNTILYQSDQISNDLNGFTVNGDGTITNFGLFGGAGSTHTPAGLASDNSGLFLYAADDAFGLAVFNIIPGVVPTLVADNAILNAGQIQGVAAYPPRSCAHTDFAVTQTASPNPVTAGNQITYTITITNNGPSTASVAIHDLLPKSSMTFVSCTPGPGGVCDKGNGLDRSITFASLASGQSGTATIVGATLSTLLNGDTITNTASPSNSSAVDPNPANNSATTNVTVSAPPTATKFIVQNSAGSYFGSTTLTTALQRVLPGAAVPNKTITFSLNGVVVGTAVTDTNGVATLANVPLVLGGIPINAGTYLTGIGVSFAGDSQYAATSATSTLTVNKDVLTVTAQNATKVYGDANPPFTYVITGFVNNETVAVVSGTASCTTSANINTSAGTAPIQCAVGTLAATNYSFVFVPATLTITPAPLVLAANNVSRLYGDPNPPLTGTVVGLKAGDQATATFSTSAVSTSPVGTYPITGTVVPGSSFLASDYTITSSGTLTVTPAPLTVTAANASRVYGDPNPPFTGTVTGLKNGDVITATFNAAAGATSPVGTYPITPTFADPGNKLGNYTVNASGTLTVTPAPLTATAADASRLYGDPNPPFTGTLTGVKNGDAITASFTSVADPTSPIGTYPITATLTGAPSLISNYTIATTNGTLTVSPATLAVAAANATRLYGDPNPAFTGTLTGIKNTDNITATYASAATPASAVGTFSIVPTLVDPTGKLGNYSVLSTNGTLTVTPAPLSVTAADVTRAYGDPNPAFTGTITGIKNLDNITATYASTAVVTSPVGTFTIVPTLSDPTAKLGNYTVTSKNGTLTIAPALLTVTGANASRLYGDANPAFTGTITGIKNGDNITATFASTAVVASPVGSFAVVPTLADPTSKLGNYSVVSNNGTLTIAPAPLSASAADATRVYGDANPAFTGALTGIKNGDNITATFTTTATPASNVGAFPIVPTLADPTLKLGNYSITLTNGTLSVTTAPLSVTAGNASRPYGDPNPAFTGTIIGLKNGDNITATVAGADAASAVGTYPLVPALVDPAGKLGNYSVTITNGTLTVTPAALAVSAGNATRAYGDPNPAFTGTITGIKNNDNITATFSTTAIQTSPVGSFAIVPTLLDPTAKLGNYSVSSTNGTLTVAPAALTVTGTNASRLYGDPNPGLTGTLTGIKNADNITATFATVAVVTSPVGNFAIVPTLVDPTAKLSNYTVTSNNGTLTINAAPLSVTGTNASRVYGDPNPAFTGTLTGIKNADNITATFSSTATAASNVGNFAIVPTLADPTNKLGNYAVISSNGTLTVTPAALTVTAGNATRVYGDPNPAFTGTITGLKNGDNITATVSGAGADPTSPVGTYALVPALQDPTGKLGNYAVTSNNGILTVTAAPLSVVTANASRAYGDPNPAFTASITGLKNADNITASFTTTAIPASPVGTFPIVVSLNDPTLKLSNYVVTASNGTLTINPAALAVAGTNATRLYGDANPAFTGTITGVKNNDNITATFSSAAVAASAVGAFPIVPALADPTNKLPNYSVTLVNGTLTVGPAPLVVTGTNASRIYGDPNPAFTGTLTGVKNADNITVTFSSAATIASNAGTYPIVGTLADPTTKLGNYAVTSNNGTLTVNQAALSVTAADASRIYGDPNPAFTGTLTGTKDGDNITVTFSSAAQTSPVGTYAIVPALVDPTGKLGNYSVTSANGTLTVGPAALSVTAASANRAYGAANPAFTGTISGIKNADNITATYSSAANTASAVGTYPITPTLLDPTAKLGNYSVTSTNGVLTVTQAKPSVVLNAQGALPSSQLVAQVLNTGPALPTGTVQFFDGSASLGSPVALAPVNGVAQASLQVALAPGAHNVTASYAGDATYTSSVSAGTAVNVPNSQFAFSSAGGNTSATISAGQNAVYNISLAPQGFTGTVSLSCSGAPTGTTCTINPTSVNFTAASASAPITVTVSGTQNARLKPFGYKTTLFVFAGVLAGLAGSRKRKEFLLVLLAAFVIVGMAACGGNPNSGGGPVVRPPTNATVTITGTSGAQNATINLSLTITH